jgi:hypothetical protein
MQLADRQSFAAGAPTSRRYARGCGFMRV